MSQVIEQLDEEYDTNGTGMPIIITSSDFKAKNYASFLIYGVVKYLLESVQLFFCF